MGGCGLSVDDAAAETRQVFVQRSEENAMSFASLSRVSILAAIAGLSAAAQTLPEVRRLTLKEAVHLAVSQNRTLKIARLKVVENVQKKAAEHTAYFPTIKNESNAMHITELQNVGIPAGTLGAVGGSLIPGENVIIPQGQTTIVSSGTQLNQPLTQLIRTRQLNRMAAAEVAVSRDDVKNAENQIALQVHTLYFGILIAGLQKQAAEKMTAYATEHLRESEEDVRNGNALKVASIQGHVGVLESQQQLLNAELQLSDLTMELNDLLGLPVHTRLELDPAVPSNFTEHPLEEYVKTAWAQNPEILAAEELVRRARAGVSAAKTAYIPDVTAYARQSYQNGVPFLVRNFGTFGVFLSWEVLDFGKRRAGVRESEARLMQAAENLRRLRDEVAVAIEKSFNKVERTKHLVQVADEIVKLRQESERLAVNQLAQGVVLVSERRQATAAMQKAQADFLQASLGHLLAWAELEQAVGRTPGL
jgi:outer membrane protein TolC